MSMGSFRDFNLEDVGEWPKAQRVGVIAAVAIGILFLGYWFDLRGQKEKIAQINLEKTKLAEQFNVDKQQIRHLKKHAEEVKVLKAQLADLNKTSTHDIELTEVLEEFSKAGIHNGLDFKLLKPLPAKQQTFYTETPIKIVIQGDYHQFGSFVSQVANQKHFITFHNFVIEHTDNKQLKMELHTRIIHPLQRGSMP